MEYMVEFDAHGHIFVNAGDEEEAEFLAKDLIQEEYPDLSMVNIMLVQKFNG